MLCPECRADDGEAEEADALLEFLGEVEESGMKAADLAGQRPLLNLVAVDAAQCFGCGREFTVWSDTAA